MYKLKNKMCQIKIELNEVKDMDTLDTRGVSIIFLHAIALALYHSFTFHEPLFTATHSHSFLAYTSIVYVGWVHKKLMLMKNEEQTATQRDPGKLSKNCMWCANFCVNIFNEMDFGLE